MTTQSSDNNVVELELTPKLKESGIVTNFVFQRSINSVIVTLNHVYDKKIIISSVSSTSDWGKIQDRLERRLKNKGIEKDHILQLIDTLDTNFEIILSSSKYKDGEQRKENLPPYREKKYTNNDSSSFEDWHDKLVQKYENLYNVIQANLPNLWHSLEFELSVLKILNIKDCTLPFGGIVLGRPSSLKTAGIELFRKETDYIYYADNFSVKSFVSHAMGLSEEQLQEQDLLPKLRNKCFLTPELAPTFTKKDEDLGEILGIMTRILDGKGYKSVSGVHGLRGYDDEMMFTWIGAAVDIPYKVHKLLTTLGPRLYFFRVPKVESDRISDEDYYDQIKSKDFANKIADIKNALFDYLDWFDICPALVEDHEKYGLLKKIEWDFGKKYT